MADWQDAHVSTTLKSSQGYGGSGGGTFNYSNIPTVDEISSPQLEQSPGIIKKPKATYFSQIKKSIIQWFLRYELIIATILLVLSTASERVTFKVMIDRMLPFKFILIEIIFIFSFLIFSAITLFKTYYTKEITNQMRKFPHSQIWIMALLDSIQFLGLVYSGVNVSPTMTVILMHASTLFVVAGSKFAFPHRTYGDLHRYGLGLIAAALVIAFMKILWCDWTSADHFSETFAAVIYIGAAALQGLSTLYKENCLVTWAQPVNIYYLSSFLFLYQFFCTFGLSILFYLYQGNLSLLLNLRLN